MDDRYTAQIWRLVEAVLISAGDTDPDTRRAVEERAVFLRGRPIGKMAICQRRCARPASRWTRSSKSR
jgi:hypothetical protein